MRLFRRGKKNKFLRTQPKDKNGLAFSVMHKVMPAAISAVTLIIANQKCARDLHYDPKIYGTPAFIFRGEPVYNPFRIFAVYLSSINKLHFVIGDTVYRDLKIFLYGTGFSVILYMVLVYVRNAMNKGDKNFYATGEWGKSKDLAEFGLNAPVGVVIGQRYEAVTTYSRKKGSLKLDVIKTAKLVCYDFNVCGMLLAPSRAGKGISTIIPTILIFPHSILVFDPKAENYEITAGYRQQFSIIIRYDPTNECTLKLNILDEISEKFAYRDANLIATTLTAPANPNSNADPHWQQTASVLITAAILHVKCSRDFEEKSLPTVYKFLSNGNELNPKNAKDKDNGDKLEEILKSITEGQHCTESIHQSAKSFANQILNAATEERGSIFSSALEALSVFNDPLVANSCDSSDFCLDDLRYSDYPISWYLTIPFSDVDRLKPLTKLIIEFICRKFSQDNTSFGNEPLKHRLLILIDEFPVLGKVESIQLFAGILNGYGISFLWIAQTKAQIEQLYGQNAPIFEHCAFTWTFAINDDNVAQYYSKRAGNEGVIKQNVSTSGSKFDYGMNNMTISNDIGERALITANEIENLPPDTELLFVQGGPTFTLKKVAYYSDPRFKDKARWRFPKTRKELLEEVKYSRVLRDGDKKWWEDFTHANSTGNSEDLYIYPDYDADGVLEKSDKTENFATEQHETEEEMDAEVQMLL